MKRLALIALACGMLLPVAAQNLPSQIASIDQQIFLLKAKIQKLQSQKELALDEMRQGLFCSECNRSKSEIERTGESFQAHLTRVHGHAIANSQILADKAKSYDQQILQLQQQIVTLGASKNQLAIAAQQEADRQRLLQEQQHQLAAQREYEARQQKLQQERERIVKNAQAAAVGYQQAGQSADNALQQMGEAFQQLQAAQSDSKTVPTASATPVDDALAKLQQMKVELDAMHAKFELQEQNIKNRSAMETLRDGAQNDVPEQVRQGMNDADRAKNFATVEMAQGFMDAAAEVAPNQVGYAYKAGKAFGSEIANTPRSGGDVAETLLNADKAAVYAEKTSPTGEQSPGTTASGKINDVAGVALNLHSAGNDAGNGDLYSMAKHGLAALKDAYSFIGSNLKKDTGIALGAAKVYDGYNDRLKAEQQKQDVRAYGQAASDGLLHRADEIQAQVDRNEELIRYYDSILKKYQK